MNLKELDAAKINFESVAKKRMELNEKIEKLSAEIDAKRSSMTADVMAGKDISKGMQEISGMTGQLEVMKSALAGVDREIQKQRSSFNEIQANAYVLGLGEYEKRANEINAKIAPLADQLNEYRLQLQDIYSKAEAERQLLAGLDPEKSRELSERLTQMGKFIPMLQRLNTGYLVISGKISVFDTNSPLLN